MSRNFLVMIMVEISVKYMKSVHFHMYVDHHIIISIYVDMYEDYNCVLPRDKITDPGKLFTQIRIFTLFESRDTSYVM